MHEFIGPPLTDFQKLFCPKETSNERSLSNFMLRNMGNKYVKIVYVLVILKISNTLKLSDLFTLKT